LRAVRGEARQLAQSDAGSYRRIWEHAAESAGATLHELGDGFFVIGREGSSTVVKRNLLMIDHPATVALALDKSVTHGLLRESGLTVTEQFEWASDSVADATNLLATHPGIWVVKPATGTGGAAGVTCGVETADDLWRAWLRASVWAERIVVDRQISGHEYRLLFLDGRVLDIVHRRLPTVCGDGTSTVGQLIVAENHRRLQAGPDEVPRLISIDLDCALALRRSGYSLKTVLRTGERVAVKGGVGDNAAGDNDTVTRASPHMPAAAILEEAERAVRLLRLRFAGVDVVTPDPARSLGEAGGAILEVNGTPGLQHHYLVRERDRATPVAVPLLETLLSGEVSTSLSADA
jgi:cyanophycin synthetase